MTKTSRRFPAEWEPQDAVLLSWPKLDAGWDDIFEAALDDYATLVATILHYEAVILCIRPDDHRLDIETRIASKRIALFPLTFVELPGNDSWARDFGPIGVEQDGQMTMVDFQFNGWGNKYPAKSDNQVSRALAGRRLIDRLITAELVMEGGSLDTNGAGTLLTTSRCLLHPERNPSLSRQDYEDRFTTLLGIQRVHWLENGWLSGDDTDGHIDMLARFTNVDTIVYTRCDDDQDEHYPSLNALEGELQNLRQANGSAYRLIALPWPQACYSAKGDRLPASYANFLIINGAVLCPVYGVPEDVIALDLLSSQFPDRVVEAIPARQFIHQGGSVHCLTMQLFRGSLLSA